MQENRIRSLGWENPLEKEMATHPSILAWEIPWRQRNLERCVSWGHKELDLTYWQNSNNMKMWILLKFAAWMTGRVSMASVERRKTAGETSLRRKIVCLDLDQLGLK